MRRSVYAYVYAAERLDKIRRQNRIKAELQAVLDEQ
ncbi:proQ/FINO family protein [Escherichia coli]|nr:proQ/FINO family protein [Escherichia coli]